MKPKLVSAALIAAMIAPSVMAGDMDQRRFYACADEAPTPTPEEWERMNSGDPAIIKAAVDGYFKRISPDMVWCMTKPYAERTPK
jgi:hypothetical protein